jgi:hypothetical protein
MTSPAFGYKQLDIIIASGVPVLSFQNFPVYWVSSNIPAKPGAG